MRILRALSVATALAVVLVGIRPAHYGSPSAPLTVSPAPGSSAAEGAARGTAAGIQDAGDSRLANKVLSDLKATYRHLDGVAVSLGATPNGEEAVAYYTDGRIVISSTHSVDVATILRHEIWHIVDWRDNGRMDWGENLPPSNPHVYVQ